MKNFFNLQGVMSRLTLLALIFTILAPVGIAAQPQYSVSISSEDVDGLTLNLEGLAEGNPYAGQFDQHNVQVVWGDGVTSDTSDIEFVEDENEDKYFSGTWSNSHTYEAEGTYTVTVRLYHGQPSGNDASADSVVTLEAEIDLSATLIVVKEVINDDEGTASAGDFTMLVTGTNVSEESFAGSEEGVTVTLDEGVYSVDEDDVEGYVKTLGEGCSGTIEAGETVTCVITNDDVEAVEEEPVDDEEPVIDEESATLIVVKEVINDDNGIASAEDFTMLVTGTNVSEESFAGSSEGVTVTLDAGEYSVDEEEADIYVKTLGEGCSGTIAAGETVTCVITNDDVEGVKEEPVDEEPATLIVQKFVINDDGKEALSEDFTMLVTGTNVSEESFAGSEEGVTVTLDAGEYSVDESAGEEGAGYSKTLGEGCSGTISAGETVTCIIVNDDNFDSAYPEARAYVLVKKTVVNDDEETLVAGDFTLNVVGEDVSEENFAGSELGTMVSMAAGEFEVSENENANYVGTFEGDCSGTVETGNIYVCTVTNDDVARSGGGGGGGSTGGGGGGGFLLPLNPSPTPTPTDDGGNVLGETAIAEPEVVPDEEDEGEVLGDTACSEYLSSYIVMGANNDSDQVYKLQLFLNEQLGSALTLSGFYDSLTFAAVKRFQEMYADEILTPWGIDEGTGLVYLTTKRWINMMKCPELDLPIPTPLVPYSQR